jgi:hypothetical protein
MKLHFAVNQGECLRRGIDCKSSTVTVEVDPADLPEDERDLIADRMLPGEISVYRLGVYLDGSIVSMAVHVPSYKGDLILADSPDYEGLIEACRKNQDEVEAEQREKAYAQTA